MCFSLHLISLSTSFIIFLFLSFCLSLSLFYPSLFLAFL
jgi:hypothetical protein